MASLPYKVWEIKCYTMSGSLLGSFEILSEKYPDSYKVSENADNKGYMYRDNSKTTIIYKGYSSQQKPLIADCFSK